MYSDGNITDIGDIAKRHAACNSHHGPYSLDITFTKAVAPLQGSYFRPLFYDDGLPDYYDPPRCCAVVRPGAPM